MQAALSIRGTIRNKIFAVSLLPVLALVAVGAINYRSLNSLGYSAERIMSRNYESIRAAQQLRWALEENRNQVLNFILRNAQGEANLLNNRFLFTPLATLNQHIAESGENRLIELLAEDLKRYDSLTKEITGIEAKRAMEECLDLTTRIVTHLDDLVELNERGMERAELETRRLAEKAQRQSIILILATIALILLLSYGFSSYVARPIRELALRLADSSRGGERYPVLPLKGEDEITLLTAEFNRLFRSLAEYDRHNADILAAEKTKVRQAEEAKARFIADLSHQLKTPMTSLGMSVSLLWEKKASLSSERVSVLLDTAKDDCHRLASLINELMDIVRLEAMSKPALYGRLDVASLVHECLRPLHKQAEEKEVRLILDLQPDLPLLSLDSLRFPWVLTNLVGNALRYTGKGGEITIRVERRDNRFYFQCHDNGCGIAPQNLSKIFERYTQLPGGDTGSAGLGLAIVKEIIERHGGGIVVASRPGEGTTFNFWIPEQLEITDAESTADRR